MDSLGEPEKRDLPDRRAKPANGESRDPADSSACPGRSVTVANADLRATQDRPGLADSRDRRACRDPRDSGERRAPPDELGTLEGSERSDMSDTRVHPETRAILERLEKPDGKVLLEKLVSKVQRAVQDCKDKWVHPEPKDSRAIVVETEVPANPESKVSRVHWDPAGLPERRETPEHPAEADRLGFKDSEDPRDRRDLPELRATAEGPARLVRRVIREIQVKQEQAARQDGLARSASRAEPAIPDRPVIRVLKE